MAHKEAQYMGFIVMRHLHTSLWPGYANISRITSRANMAAEATLPVTVIFACCNSLHLANDIENAKL